MPKIDETGIFQLENGYYGLRYAIMVEGKRVDRKRTTDDIRNPFKTKLSAYNARKDLIERDKALLKLQKDSNVKVTDTKITIKKVYDEYCKNSRSGKAYSTITKQDSLWKNHINANFGKKLLKDVTVAEINDYLEMLYYKEGRAYSYTESFLKMFYLIYGQAYSRNYLTAEHYDKFCQNKSTKIRMPKRKLDEEDEIVTFTSEQIELLNNYFNGCNAETAFMIGKCCGLRIGESYGILWKNIDLEKGVIKIEQQLQYQNGVYKLTTLKTQNAKREVIISSQLNKYLIELQEKVKIAQIDLAEQREQNQIMLINLDGSKISSLELVNSLLNGKMQTINSMKYHTQQIQALYNIHFKYHYLRHTYGTNLALLNTPMHILCNQMGHSSGNVTQKYYLGQSQIGIDILRANLDKIK